MPNVTSVWDFSPGETLTAAKLDDVNCGIHVFSGTATRDAAYGGSGERALSEGEFAYLADTNTTQYYDGAAWQTVGGGLTLIKTQTIGSAVSSVTVSDAFSSTYDNYFITIYGGALSVTNESLQLKLGSTTTGYYWASPYAQYAGGTNMTGAQNGAHFGFAGDASTNVIAGSFSLLGPNQAKNTIYQSGFIRLTTNGITGFAGGYLADNTQYTAFTLTPNTGTMTGGTIRVYGYQNS